MFIACYVILLFSLSFAENANDISKVGAPDNAAVYYNKAFELMKNYPDEIDKKILDVVQNGWKGEDAELEKILAENEPAFKEFEKGLALEKCDFTLGKIYDNPYTQQGVNLLKARSVSSLAILRGRWYERQNNYNQAIKQYLSLLTFSQHISQDKLLVSLIVARAIENMTLRPLQQYLEQKEINIQLCKEILFFLENLEFKRSTLTEVMEKEKGDYLWIGQNLVNDIQKKAVQEGKSEKIEEFAKTISESFKEFAEIYYSPLILFAQTNSETDKQNFEDKVKTLNKKLSSDTDFSDLLSLIIANPAKRTKNIIDKVAELAAATTLPNIIRASEFYYSSEAIFRILKASTAVRIYLFEKNILPDILENLTPKYLKDIPRDPYSQQNLIYKKENNAFIIYSVGKDREDNGGDGDFDFIAPPEKSGKDIVLRFSI